MEKYQKVLKNRIKVLASVMILAVALVVMDYLGVFKAIGSNFLENEMKGFQKGTLMGMLMTMIVICGYFIVRYCSVLKDEKKLRKLYNHENDEREKMIKNKTGAHVTILSATVLIFVAIIAGYFNQIVSLTLIGCAIFQLSLSVLLKLYYSNKY